MLAFLVLLGAAIGSSSKSFAQSDPFLGTWQLNLGKSRYSPGPQPMNQTVTIQADGQNHKLVIATTDAAGKSTSSTIMRAYDGMPHPAPGNTGYDAEAATRVDAHTVIINRSKGGKLVEIDTMSVSVDGKTRTYTTVGIDMNGRPVSNMTVFDK
jgi:hypothetical protein